MAIAFEAHAQVAGEAEAAAARIEQIDAALLTRAPCALDHALLLVERKSVYEALHPEATHGGDRKSLRYREIKTQSISFCSDAAQRLGLSERSVQLAVSMGEALLPLADALRSSPIVDNAAALRTFAALEASNRQAVLSLWGDNPKLSFKAALTAARLRAADDSDEAAFRALLASWTRGGSKARRRFLEEIGVDKTAAMAVVASWRKRGGK